VLTRRVYPSPVLVAKSRVKLILQSMQNGEINHIRRWINRCDVNVLDSRDEILLDRFKI